MKKQITQAAFMAVYNRRRVKSLEKLESQSSPPADERAQRLDRLQREAASWCIREQGYERRHAKWLKG